MAWGYREVVAMLGSKVGGMLLAQTRVETRRANPEERTLNF
jgi:hypothetical protein